LSVVALVGAWLGCASLQGSTAGDFHATGEVKCKYNGASFSATQVVGPKINVAQRPDGSWGGLIEQEPLDANWVNGKLKGGQPLKMAVQKTGDTLTITGQWRERLFRFEVSPSLLRVRTDTRSLDYRRSPDGAYGPYSDVHLVGDALAIPESPAFAMALVAAFI
jgi:hypothetical protein